MQGNNLYPVFWISLSWLWISTHARSYFLVFISILLVPFSGSGTALKIILGISVLENKDVVQLLCFSLKILRKSTNDALRLHIGLLPTFLLNLRMFLLKQTAVNSSHQIQIRIDALVSYKRVITKGQSDVPGRSIILCF